MTHLRHWGLAVGLFVGIFLLSGTSLPKDIQQPEQLVSKRITVYDKKTYEELAHLWEAYYDEFPSENAYANWMYAARYAGDEDYKKLLDKGRKKYPANPTLLYLAAMEKSGMHIDIEARQYLERATELDPTLVDPWFGLVTIYMDQGEEEQMDLALRKLLEGGAINEEIMDYNYNKLLALQENAILITNGDMDTFPGWVLTRILDFRSDVTIVNRSLLNTEWYPLYMMDHGLPKFITKSKLEDLRKSIIDKMNKKGGDVPYGGPYGDMLISKIIETAGKVGRPVYFAWTMYQTEPLEEYWDNGHAMALATLVTPLDVPYEKELERTIKVVLNEFRTGGMDSWRIRYAIKADAAKMILSNYASGMQVWIVSTNDKIAAYRLPLFHWYQDHVVHWLSQEYSDGMTEMWCGVKDIPEIQQWCRSLGISQ